ncbi:ATP-binding protein [Kitasatospora sp. NRRL B-11411]|uniref:ATP-binding protein n=1 Tax=Kitasatospora sp. NRRL B-11411 TaxID=1463822 RepID=UPI00068CED6C|nr:ATP-binding protein [Kitasatospora sp. NRRL B-11411]
MFVTGTEPTRRYHALLAGLRPDDVRVLRGITRLHLQLWDKKDLEELAALGVSELLTNVLKHAATDSCELLVCETDAGVVVEVTDRCNTLPVIKDPTDDGVDGRGLHMLAGMAASIDFCPLTTGKCVRLTLSSAEHQR